MKIIAAPPGSQKPEVVCEVDDDLGSFAEGAGVIRDTHRTIITTLGPGYMGREFHIELPGRLLVGCRIVRMRHGSGELSISYLREEPWENA